MSVSYCSPTIAAIFLLHVCPFRHHDHAVARRAASNPFPTPIAKLGFALLFTLLMYPVAAPLYPV